MNEQYNKTESKNKQLSVRAEIPVDSHDKLRILSAIHGKSMKKFVEGLILREINKAELPEVN